MRGKIYDARGERFDIGSLEPYVFHKSIYFITIFTCIQLPAEQRRLRPWLCCLFSIRASAKLLPFLSRRDVFLIHFQLTFV